jgi:hypothetical protein
MRSFAKYIFLFLFLLPLSLAKADVTIFDVRKNLPMSDSDPVYRDFIINGGSEAGLSVGTIFTVQRRIPLYDSYQNRSAGDLNLKVARIKIIQVQKGLAVARLHSEFTREAMPIIEENYIMVGDTIDLGSATSDKKAEAPAAEKEPTAAAEPPPKPAPVVPAGSSQTTAQIVVNTVDLSSKSAKAPAPSPEKVDVPTLQ